MPLCTLTFSVDGFTSSSSYWFNAHFPPIASKTFMHDMPLCLRSFEMSAFEYSTFGDLCPCLGISKFVEGGNLWGRAFATYPYPIDRLPVFVNTFIECCHGCDSLGCGNH